MKAPRGLRGAPLLIVAVGALALPGAAQAGLLSSASASLTGAKSGSITQGDLVRVSSSDADASGSSWDAVAIGGETIIGKKATTGAEQNQWAGVLADLGPVIDSGNAATCDPGKNYCVRVIEGAAFASDSEAGLLSSAGGNLALVIVTTDSGTSAAAVGGSSAFYADADDFCTRSAASSYVLVYQVGEQFNVVDPSSASANDCPF